MNTKNEQIINKFLYPYLSTIGPNMIEPINIPKGNKEASVPVEISFNENFEVRAGKIEPIEIKTIPKISIPKQAALKTKPFLYIYYSFIVIITELILFIMIFIRLKIP